MLRISLHDESVEDVWNIYTIHAHLSVRIEAEVKQSGAMTKATCFSSQNPPGRLAAYG